MEQLLKLQEDFSKFAKMFGISMIEKTPLATATAEEQKEPAAPWAEILSMPIKDGRCAHQLAGLLLELLEGLSGDPSQLAKNKGETQVLQARALLLENCVKITQKLEDFAYVVDDEHFASAQWKEMLGHLPRRSLISSREAKTGEEQSSLLWSCGLPNWISQLFRGT